MSKSTPGSSSGVSDRSQRRSYSDEFRRDVVRLITDEGYSIPAAAKACGASEQTVRNWYGRIAPAPEPAGDDATVEELRAEVARPSHSPTFVAARQFTPETRREAATKMQRQKSQTRKIRPADFQLQTLISTRMEKSLSPNSSRHLNRWM